MPLETKEKQESQQDNQSGKRPSRFSEKWKQLKSAAATWWQTRLAQWNIWTHKKHKHFSQTQAFYRIGQYLYEVGFSAEYTTVKAGRMICAFSKLSWRGLKWISKNIGRKILDFCTELAVDLFGPITAIAKGAKGLTTTAKHQYQNKGAAQAAKQSAVYIGTGILKYIRVVGRCASYALPVAGILVFVTTVNEKLNQTYALAVECNGEIVGYVEDELVFDEARDKVKSRIVLAKDQDWDVDPTFTLATSQEVMDVNATADAILRASANEIQEATGVEVDGQLVAITNNGTQLQRYLAGRKAEYEQPDNPNLRVEFAQTVETVDGLYASESVQDVHQVEAMLSGLKEEQQQYQIQPGDSLTLVASNFNLTSAQLKELNPKLADENYKWPIGDTLVVHQEVPFLQVKTIETVTAQETIPFKTEKRDDPELAYGKEVTDQQGQNGLDEAVYEYVKVNGILTEVNELSRVRLQDPVNEVIRRGTKMPKGSVSDTAVFSSGSMMWPVPGYTGVSRWASAGHKGTDITARYGTPIVAADSGVVTAAGMNAAGRGYGNSIIINHGSGNTTLYAHCSSLAVYAGQSVSKGQVIGYVGSTGYSTGNHLHFEIRKSGVLVNAKNYFSGK